VGLDEELFEAVGDGNAAKVRELLKRGANPNAKNEHGWTPLHRAAYRGHADVARLLLEHGADANAKSKDSFFPTPLHLAAAVGHVDVTKLLLEHGADANAKNKYGYTPLHFAANKGHAEVARLLLEYGANVNAKEKDGFTPLHFAAAFGYAVVARLLLEHGADPSIGDNDSVTPLDIARAAGHEEVARVIEEYKRGGGVRVSATPVGVSAREPAPAAPSILGVECSELYAGEWGRLLVRVRGLGTASLSLEGDVEWLDPGRVKLSGDAVVEVPVKPRAASGVPVRVVVKSPSGEDAKITWLKVVDRAGKCPACSAPIEPGAKYCWKCGTKLR
jgi:cytohesin